MTKSSTADSSFAVTTFVSFMTVFGTAQQKLKERMQEDAANDLGPLHMSALCRCLKNPGGTQQQLVAAMGKDKGQIARLTQELEKRGLLVRSPDAKDGRVWHLTVTPEGERQCAWFFAIEADIAGELFGQLGKAEQAQLEAILATVTQRMAGL